MKQFGFPAARRIRSPLDFTRIYDQRERAGDQYLLVFGARNDLGYTRIGLSVSRKHGNAVKRVRLKRLLREAFRQSQHELPQGLDLILIPRQNSGEGLEEFQRSLRKAAEKLARRLDVGTAS